MRCSFERVAKGRRRYPDKGWESEEEEQEEWITLRIFFFSLFFSIHSKNEQRARGRTRSTRFARMTLRDRLALSPPSFFSIHYNSVTKREPYAPPQSSFLLLQQHPSAL